MRTFLPGWLLLAAIILSCEKPLFDSPSRDARAGVRALDGRDRSDSETAPDPAPAGPVVSLTALCYPDSVDWRANPLAEHAQVVLFQNGQRRVSVPVDGPPDPERHRVQRGQLWTDATDGAETIVRCNGAERFRHPGAELYRGFLVTGGAVHTLGQRPGREGLCYRVDGEERFSASIGTILGSADDHQWPGGAFCHDSTGLYYTYGVPVRTADGLLWEYRVMRGDEPFRTLPAGTAQALFDLRVLDGTVYRSESRSSPSAGYFWVADGQSVRIGTGARETLHLCKLVPLDGRMLLKGYHTGRGGASCTFWLWSPEQTLCSAVAQQPIAELLYDGRHTAYVTVDPDTEAVLEVFWDGEALPLPPGAFRLATPRCTALHEGVFGLALSAVEGNDHLLLLDGALSPYTFNGYFTSIEID